MTETRSPPSLSLSSNSNKRKTSETILQHNGDGLPLVPELDVSVPVEEALLFVKVESSSSSGSADYKNHKDGHTRLPA